MESIFNYTLPKISFHDNFEESATTSRTSPTPGRFEREPSCFRHEILNIYASVGIRVSSLAEQVTKRACSVKS